jgi:hypothetical protein
MHFVCGGGGIWCKVGGVGARSRTCQSVSLSLTTPELLKKILRNESELHYILPSRSSSNVKYGKEQTDSDWTFGGVKGGYK